jgi:hypothetical protein
MKGKWRNLLIFATVIAVALSACSSLGRGAQQGVRDGVSRGVAGLFTGGGSGSSGGSDVSTGDVGGAESSAPDRNYSGSSQTVPWPSSSTWARYGLEGLRQPAGTDVVGAALYMGQYMVSLINGGEPALNDLMSQIDVMPGAELTTEMNTSDGKMVGYLVTGGSITITADLLNGDIVIMAQK